MLLCRLILSRPAMGSESQLGHATGQKDLLVHIHITSNVLSPTSTDLPILVALHGAEIPAST